MRRGAWPASLAATLLLAASGTSAEPIRPGSRGGAPIWEQHGAGRTDGLAVGAYPLPARSERRDDGVPPDPGAQERWLRRHYQWLRALNELLSPENSVVERRAGKESPFPAAIRPGTLRVDDMVVLYEGQGQELSAPHLLDDGRRSEDPEIGPASGETLEYVVSNRLEIETAKIVAGFFSPLARDTRAALGDALLAAERQRAPRLDLPQLFAAPSAEAAPSTPDRARPPREPISLPAFLKTIMVDVLSAPTTYLLSLFAALGWLILRATVFSRN